MPSVELNVTSASSPLHNLQYWIPVNVLKVSAKGEEGVVQVVSEVPAPLTWLPPSHQGAGFVVRELPQLEEGDILVFNPRQTGFYRVNYDLKSWSRIQSFLRRHFHILDPYLLTQIIDDLAALAKAGLVPYHVALDITR